MHFIYTIPILLQLIKSSSILQIRQEQRYDWIWDDADSGSDLDGGFWKPKLNPGESFVSFVNTVGWHEPIDVISTIITQSPPGALADPLGYLWIWDDSGSGGDHDVWFFKPVAPASYVCLGDFVSRSSNVHSWDGFKCIHEDYVNRLEDSEVQQFKKWNDKGSGADDDGQVIQINVPGYPHQYFRMRGGYHDKVDGPFYSFNLYSRNCRVLKVVADAALTDQILFGVADISNTITYTNTGVNVGTTQGFGVNKCIESSSSFTRTTGSKLGITTTYGYEYKAGNEALGTSSTHTFELSIAAEFTKEYSETTTTTVNICSNIPEQEVPCPGRTTCKREYIVFTASNKEIPIAITVQCGNSQQEVIEGTFTATGAGSILVEDSFTPLDCPYYTDDYADRGDGKLPFCDTCYNPHECIICRDGMVLIDGGCYEDRKCTEECHGTIQSPSQTVPHSTTPDFAGRYCINEDKTLSSCVNALYAPIVQWKAFSGNDYVECPSNYAAISCGFESVQNGNGVEKWWAAYPDTSAPHNRCQGYEYYAGNLYSVCARTQEVGNLVVVSDDFTSGSVSCPQDYVVSGCGVRAHNIGDGSWEVFKQVYPNQDGKSCQCYNYFGNICYATCIRSDKVDTTIKSVTYGNGGQQRVTCDSSQVALGCGILMHGSPQIEVNPKYNVDPLDARSCVGYSSQAFNLYAICGKFKQ